MGRYAAGGPTTGAGNDADEALERALRQRTAQRVTDLREPQLRATGTSRISQLLADARQKRDDEAEASAKEAEHRSEHRDDDPGGGRLRWWVPPLSGPQAPGEPIPAAPGQIDPPGWAPGGPRPVDHHQVVPPRPAEQLDGGPPDAAEGRRPVDR